MASTEKFCLKWNDFENNISAAFCDLRDEKDFFDVTLVVGETQVSAHKVILAASSQFFRKVLKANPHQHPLLYLRGVKHKELLSILSFMYRGQVNIAQEELSQFLAVAEDLQVKGLTQSQSHSQSHTNVNKNIPRPEKIAPAITSGASDTSRHPPPLLYQQGMKEEDDEIVECISVTETTSAAANKQVVPTEALDERDEHLAIRSDYNDQYLPIQDQENPSMDQGNWQVCFVKAHISCNAVSPSFNEFACLKSFSFMVEFVSLIQSKMYRVAGESSGVWQCSECSYSSKVKCNVSQHIEAKHIQHGGYYCFICHKTCPSKNAFRMHNKRNHEHPKENLYQ